MPQTIATGSHRPAGPADHPCPAPAAAGGRAEPRRRDAGMTTAEYAVGTIAACSFATLLWALAHSPSVQATLTDLITRALHTL